MARKQSLRVVAGYGQSLRSRLKAAGMTQVQLANAAGISRQTVSRALANDQVSAQTERLIDDALARAATPNPRALTRAPEPWARATDLAQWADRRNAQHEFPAIVSSLIRLTTPDLNRISFRAGEGVQLGGWDGRVSARAATPFVPSGESGWELGTAVRVADQAQSNYEKRTAEPGLDPKQATFVFVTLRRWAQKDTWVAAREGEGVWRSVRVLDADDLDLWLQDAPSVHLRLSRLIGAFPTGAQDLRYWWENWSGATRPALTPEFVLAGRGDAAKQIQHNLQGPGSVFAIKSESRAESIAVLAATLKTRSGGESEAFDRTIVVEDASAWRTLVASRSPLVMVPHFEVGDAVSAAVRAGHVVVLPLGEGDLEAESTVALPQVGRGEAAAALKAAGLPSDGSVRDDQKADELAKLARRSMTALRRRIALGSQLQRPSWARPENARKVLPALFAASWNEAVAGDKALLEALSAKACSELANDLDVFAHGADPAVRRRGSIWYLVSRQDAWDSLNRFVSDNDVERFRVAATRVLSAVDPLFDMPRDKRWLAGFSENKPAHSGLLRRGLAETVALIGARTDYSARRENTGSFGGASSLPDVAYRVVRDVLEEANRDWRIWASLSDMLPELAEAAPDIFLSALENGLKADPSPVATLFDEEGDGMFGGPSPHTGLLWALERLAWSSDHLGHVVRILAELVRRDPGGKLANRPEATLRAIFRPWMPQTSAPLARRFGILDTLARTHEEIAWKVLISTLPEFHAVGSYSAHPHWREWDSAPRPVTRSEYEAAVGGAVERLLQFVGTNGERWGELIAAIPNMGAREFEAILTQLDRLVGLQEKDATKIATALRELVSRHRNFPDAQWALSKELIDRIDAVRTRFEPSDPVERFQWLFTWHPDLPNPEGNKIEDYHAYEKEIHAARIEAVETVASHSGLTGLLRLASASKEPAFVGEAVAKAGLLQDEEALVLREHIASAVPHQSAFARGYALARLQIYGQQWVEDTINRLGAALTPVQQAHLLGLLDSTPEVWALAASLGPRTEREYWQTVWFVRDEKHIEEGARQLIKFGRVDRAAHLVGMYARKSTINPQLVVDLLQRILAGEAAQLDPNFRYHLPVLIDQLHGGDGVTNSDVARIEWGFLPVLEHGHDPKALHALLAAEPEFFVELVKLVFRGEDDPPKAPEEITDEDRDRASRAYSLLHSWRTMPGLRDNRTSVDSALLMDWVSRARRLLHESHRAAIGDQLIGQMLSGAPYDPDGTWPHTAVRGVIETVASDELERGLAMGKYNSRGVVTKAIGEGGRQERAIAEKFEGLAAAVVDTSPRTARMLRDMANSYKREADREDREVAVEDDLGR
jgi:transcriptional regulator with XRE-family HTH domain